MKKGVKTRDIIVIMVILTIIITVILVAINIFSSKLNKTKTKASADRNYIEIEDSIKNMLQSADLEVWYKVSEKRIVIYMIGSDGYYGLRFDNNKLYLSEGSYQTATTDEAKIREATDSLNSNSGYKLYADNIMSFNVGGADADGLFTGGTISLTIGVQENGELARNEFSVPVVTGAAE